MKSFLSLALLAGSFLLIAACASERGPVDQASEGATENPRVNSDPTITDSVGKTRWFSGPAQLAPYIKENRSAVQIDGQVVFLVGEFKPFSPLDIGRAVSIKGKVLKKRWPMFIMTKEMKEAGAPVPQGMPMPEGTDLEKASVYYALEDPEWKFIK